MKALYIILGFGIALAVLLGNPAVQFSAMGAAFGWLFYEKNKERRYGKQDIHRD